MRHLLILATLAAPFIAGSVSCVEAIAVERYISAHGFNKSDFSWTYNGWMAAHRSPTGRWEFSGRHMAEGILFATCTNPPQASGMPMRILIAAPFLKLGV